MVEAFRGGVTLKRGQGFRAHVMFDAFRVGLRYCVWHTQRPEESRHSLMAAPGFLRQPQALIR